MSPAPWALESGSWLAVLTGICVHPAASTVMSLAAAAGIAARGSPPRSIAAVSRRENQRLRGGRELRGNHDFRGPEDPDVDELVRVLAFGDLVGHEDVLELNHEGVEVHHRLRGKLGEHHLRAVLRLLGELHVEARLFLLVGDGDLERVRVGPLAGVGTQGHRHAMVTPRPPARRVRESGSWSSPMNGLVLRTME